MTDAKEKKKKKKMKETKTILKFVQSLASLASLLFLSAGLDALKRTDQLHLIFLNFRLIFFFDLFSSLYRPHVRFAAKMSTEVNEEEEEDEKGKVDNEANHESNAIEDETATKTIGRPRIDRSFDKRSLAANESRSNGRTPARLFDRCP